MEDITPPPLGPTDALTPHAHPPTPTPALPKVFIKVVGDTTGPPPPQGDLAAAIGGSVGAVLLLFVCVLALLLWCLSRHKGSYVTNEMDQDEEEEEGIVNNEDDDESDVGLQTREPLRVTEEE